MDINKENLIDKKINKKEEFSEEELCEMDQFERIVRAVCDRYGNPSLMNPFERAELLSQFSNEELEAILEDCENHYGNY